jgi:hypothetical protein
LKEFKASLMGIEPEYPDVTIKKIIWDRGLHNEIDLHRLVKAISVRFVSY